MAGWICLAWPIRFQLETENFNLETQVASRLIPIQLSKIPGPLPQLLAAHG
jgi:hypothetical protein